ncbi:hypothetical protein A8990_16815 [Paenibacillus taihuensis]|uniref:Cache domain-containing protein n=1 Tax=Paenibacillus taihuensis TaxID=1156355 RepID=A0A3D9Q3F7_9BACL|nr:cache domain-containing protein [Paenibacillus taihuensis]REE55444.1 hypothetical protein A8990_16815 [Paenibacillus taihuensis]
MKLKFRSKKYLVRIFLWMTCITLLIVSSLSALIYYNVERNVFKSEYNNSQKVLSQVKCNIDYLDTMIRNLTLSTYSNNDVKALMYLNYEETYESLSVINKLNASIIANYPFLHSIYIYNNHKKLYCSTYGDLFHKDVGLDNLLDSYDHIPALRAIVRQMDGQTVLSYIMYETMDSEKHIDGAVILNINLDWLVNNIKAVNQMDESTNSQLYILDSSNQLTKMVPCRPGQKCGCDSIEAARLLVRSDECEERARADGVGRRRVLLRPDYRNG